MSQPPDNFSHDSQPAMDTDLEALAAAGSSEIQESTAAVPRSWKMRLGVLTAILALFAGGNLVLMAAPQLAEYFSFVPESPRLPTSQRDPHSCSASKSCSASATSCCASKAESCPLSQTTTAAAAACCSEASADACPMQSLNAAVNALLEGVPAETTQPDDAAATEANSGEAAATESAASEAASSETVTEDAATSAADTEQPAVE